MRMSACSRGAHAAVDHTHVVQQDRWRMGSLAPGARRGLRREREIGYAWEARECPAMLACSGKSKGTLLRLMILVNSL